MAENGKAMNESKAKMSLKEVKERLKLLSNSDLEEFERRQNEQFWFLKKACIDIPMAQQASTSPIIFQKIISDKNFFLGFASALTVLAITLFAQVPMHLDGTTARQTLAISISLLGTLTMVLAGIVLFKYRGLNKSETQQINYLLKKSMEIVASVKEGLDHQQEIIIAIIDEQLRRKTERQAKK